MGGWTCGFMLKAWVVGFMSPCYMLADMDILRSSTGLQISRELPRHMFVASDLFGRIPPPARNHRPRDFGAGQAHADLADPSEGPRTPICSCVTAPVRTGELTSLPPSSSIDPPYTLRTLL